MFWRYLSLTLLLLSPGSRILTSATYEVSKEKLEGGSRLTARETDDALIDRIVKQLVASEHGYAPGTIPLANEPGKRDDSIGGGTSIDNNGNKQLQQQQQQTGSSGSRDKDGVVGGGLSGADGKDDGVESPAAGGVVHHPPGRAAALSQEQHEKETSRGTRVIPTDDKKFIFTMAAVLCVGFVGLMMAGVCYYKFRRSAKAASDVEYPAYGVTGPMKERVPSPGDRKLAQSAQMYHYQHQKQQMIAMEKANGDMKHDASDEESEEDNVEGDYTVYECPGLAPTGEMEVKNPLFRGNDIPQAPGPPDLPGGGQQTPPRE